MESHYKIANELCNIDGVNDVQASEERLVIVVAPSEPNAVGISALQDGEDVNVRS